MLLMLSHKHLYHDLGKPANALRYLASAEAALNPAAVQRLGFVASVCPDGTPNLSPKGTVINFSLKTGNGPIP